MFVTIVDIYVKTEHIEEFIQISSYNHQQSIKEAGNRRFDFIQQRDDPNHFVFYEAYQRESDVALHQQTAHYQRWRDTVNPWMLKPRQGTVFKGIKPE